MRAWAMAALALSGCILTGGDDSGERCGGTSCAPGSLIWTTQASSPNRVWISAVAPSPGEPPWFAGSNLARLDLEGEIFARESGINDAFVARVEARELPTVWAGFAGALFSQQTAGVLPDGEQGAVLITYGDVPGAGWRTDAYVIGRSALAVEHAVLVPMNLAPSTGVAAVAARDGAGWPVVAVSGSDLEIDPLVGGRRAVVLRVLQALTTEKLFDQTGIEITAIAPDTRETLVIGGHYDGTPPGWPTCAEVMCGFAAIIDAHPGSETPVQRLLVYRASEGADVLAVGTNGAGRLTVLGTHAGESLEPTFSGPPYPTLWLDFVEENERLAQGLASGGDDGLSGARLVATDLGAVVALSFHGSITVDDGDDISSDGIGDDDLLIAEYAAELSGEPWHLTVRTDGSTQLTALAVEGTQVAVGGNFTGQLSISTGTVLERAVDSQGFVLELRR